jgi:hypothetical protein
MLVSMQPKTSPAPERQPLVETEPDDGDRPSITEVNGTIARFEMAFEPRENERFAFGPPIWQQAPSFLFLGFALALAFLLTAATHAPSNSAMFRWVAERPATQPASIIILLCAIGTVARTLLRGVIVTKDAIETRDLVAGFPKVRKYRWAQIDRLVIDEEDVLLELWDGTYERLPKVRKGAELCDLLVRVAIARKRDVTRLEPKAKKKK